MGLEYEINRKGKRKVGRNIGISILILIVLFYLIVTFIPTNKRVSKPFFENGGKTLVMAHQGGELLAPSNTLAAFQNAVNLGVDVLEFDLHITKDGYLVIIHDPTVDRTTNGTGKVAGLTIKEIQHLDAGYYFKDLNGEYSYRGKGVYIPTLEEVFQKFGKMKMNIEIKDDNPPDTFKVIDEKLWKLIQKYHMEDKVNIVSFDQNVVNNFHKLTKGRVAVSGGKQEITKFVILDKLYLNNLYRPTVDAIQIPTQQSGIDLTDKRLIDDAHRHGMYVHYWTIDDEATMRKLLRLGVDGIMTNRPDLLIKIMKNKDY